MDRSSYHLLALFIGVATHVFYFNRYEIHRDIHTVICSFFIAVTFCLWIYSRISNIWLGVFMTTQVALCYLAGAFGSTLVYRLFLNPLNRFPGPYSARLTDFWMSIHVGKNLDQYQKLDALHKKYGRYVRTGANQLSIIDPNLVELAYAGSQKSGVTKAGWYDFDFPAKSLLSERTFHGHSQRRRLWAPAFSDKALRRYETKVTEYNDKFLNRVAQLQSQQGFINVSELFGLYSFDVMGSLVFGEDYKMLETNKKHHALELLTEGLSSLGLTLPIWFFILVKSIPWDLGGTGNFNAFCDAQVEKSVQKRKFSIQAIRRFSVKTIRKFSIMSIPRDLGGTGNFCGAQAERTVQRRKFDAFCDAKVEQAVSRRRSVMEKKADPSTEDQRSILYWVLKTYGDKPNLEKDIFLRTDARLLIVAGSDTTAATFTYLFYHLAQRPTDVERIREEINDCIKGVEEWTEKDIRHCQHLNGAINEALRLHPPGPSGVHRMTPAEGLHVGREVFIPGGTNFNMPFYTLNRDESIYTNADSFVPERWYSEPELVKHKNAFIPFLAGSYSCLGKNLALKELRTLTARVLMEYDVSLAPGEDGSRLLQDSQDHFTISLAPLDLVFTANRQRQDSGFANTMNADFMGAGGARYEFGNWAGLRRDSCISRETIPEEALQSWTW